MMLKQQKRFELLRMTDQPLTQLLQQRLRFAKRVQDAHAAVLIAITNEDDPKIC